MLLKHLKQQQEHDNQKNIKLFINQRNLCFPCYTSQKPFSDAR